MALIAHVINTTVSGTAQQITTDHIYSTNVSFQLDDSAAGPAYIGGSGVTGASDAYCSLAPGQIKSFDAGIFYGKMGETFDISQFYVVGVAADQLHTIYFLRGA